MGRDIHFYVERYSSDTDYGGPKDLDELRNIALCNITNTNNDNERWITADNWVKENDGGYIYWDVPRPDRYYCGRNYYLFDILSGYEDIRHTANNLVSDNLIPRPRGVPEFISTAYKKQLEMYEGDSHTHSYFTLKELLDIDWSKYNIEYIKTFLDTIEKMKLIDDDTSKVRCVFFFDN